MGSVVDYMTCQCGGVRMNDWNYRTGEETDFCLKCGKFYKALRYTDETGEYVLEDAVTTDGKPFKRLALKVEKGGGYGSARLFYKDVSAGRFYFFNSKEEVLNFKEQVESTHGTGELDLDLDHTYIFSYDPETLTGEVLYGFGNPEEDLDSSESESVELSEDLLKAEKGNRDELEIVKSSSGYDIVKLYATEAGSLGDIFNSKDELLTAYPETQIIVEGYTLFDPAKSEFPSGRLFYETIEEAEAGIWSLPF